MTAPVYKVPQENVVEVLDIVLFAVEERTPKHPEEVEQVRQLTMDIPEYFDRSLN